jgi:hypothetical protein
MPEFGIPVFDQPELLIQFTVGFLSAIVIRTLRTLNIYVFGLIASYVVFFPFVTLLIFGYIGALLGLIVNGLGSSILDRRKNLFSFALVGMMGFAFTPLAFAGPKNSIAWLTRPSLNTCRAAQFQIAMGASRLTFSGDPAFYIQDFRKQLHGDSHSISTAERGNMSQFLYFCGGALAAKTPIKNIALEVRPEWLSDSWIKENCDRPFVRLKKELCALAIARTRSDYNEHIEGIIIYPANLADRYFGFMHDHKEQLRYDNTVSFFCERGQNENSGRSYCLAGGQLSNGIFFRVKFVTSLDQAVGAAQNKHRIVSLFQAMSNR